MHRSCVYRLGCDIRLIWLLCQWLVFDCHIRDFALMTVMDSLQPQSLGDKRHVRSVVFYWFRSFTDLILDN